MSAFGAAGTAANSTGTSYATSAPTGITAGQLILIVEAWANTGMVAPATNPMLGGSDAGFTRVGDFSGGSGTFGSGTGPRGITVWMKVADGTESSASYTIFNDSGTATGRTARTEISRHTATVGTFNTNSVHAVAGADANTDTAYSATASGDTSPHATINDTIYVATALATTGSPTFTTPALTWTGITMAALTTAATGTATGGNGVRLIFHRTNITAGASSAAPVFTGTLGTGGSGFSVIITIREQVQTRSNTETGGGVDYTAYGYLQEIIAASTTPPAYHFKFDETSGTTVLDYSGYGRDATWNGSPTLGAASALLEDAGKSATLDGSTAYAERAFETAMVMDTFCVSAWVNTTIGGATGVQTIFSRRIRGGTSNSNQAFDMCLNNNTLTAGIHHTSSSVTSFTTGDITAGWVVGGWNHVVLHYDGVAVRWFLNGVCVYANAETRSIINGTRGISIGRNWATADGFLTGGVDEVTYWVDNPPPISKIGVLYSVGRGCIGLDDNAKTVLQSTTLTAPAGRVASNVTGVWDVNLADMSTAWWTATSTDLGNVRVRDHGVTVPFDIVWYDQSAKTGLLCFKAPLYPISTSAFTVDVVSGAKALKVDHTNGRNNVWSAYTVIHDFRGGFPNGFEHCSGLVDRTGSGADAGLFGTPTLTVGTGLDTASGTGHAETHYITRPASHPQWTMYADSVQDSDPGASDQYLLSLTALASTSDSARLSLIHDDGSERAMWNSADLFVYSGTSLTSFPAAAGDWGVHDVTGNYRGIFTDGAQPAGSTGVTNEGTATTYPTGAAQLSLYTGIEDATVTAAVRFRGLIKRVYAINTRLSADTIAAQQASWRASGFWGTATAVPATKRCTFDGVTEAATVDATSTASGSGDAVSSSNGTPTALAASAIRGAKGVEISASAVSEFVTMNHSTAVDTLGQQVDFTLPPTAATGSAHNILQILTSASVVAGFIRYDVSTQLLRVCDAAGTVKHTFNGGVAMPAGDYTAQLTITKGTSTSDGRLLGWCRRVSDDQLVSAPYDSGATSNTGTSQVDRVRMGKTGSANDLTMDFDSMGFLAASTAEMDRLSNLVSLSRSESDTGAGTDAVTKAQTFARTAGDTAAATDAVARVLAFARALSDAAAATDAVARLLVTARALSDAAAGTDANARSSTRGRSESDTAPAVDTDAHGLTQARAQSDTGAGTDAVARFLVLLRVATDAAAAADTDARSVTQARTSTDAAPAVDADVRAAQAFSRALTDAAPAVDGNTWQLGFMVANTEAGGGTDATSRLVALTRALADTAPAVDVTVPLLVLGAVALFRDLTETAPATDANSHALAQSRAASDTAPAVDGLELGLQLARAIAESATTVDATAAVVAFSRLCLEAAAGADQVVTQFTNGRSLTDAAPAVDTLVAGLIFVHRIVTARLEGRAWDAGLERRPYGARIEPSPWKAKVP